MVTAKVLFLMMTLVRAGLDRRTMVEKREQTDYNRCQLIVEQLRER